MGGVSGVAELFDPGEIGLFEAPGRPYAWLMTKSLMWSGTFRGTPRHLQVPATDDKPFLTDLASVPRSLTWLFPRYGKYTKAAVMHDYLCQNFSRPRSPDEDEHSLLPLVDRSDADEMFRVLMHELGVPPLRRWLMWGAVSWATIFTSLVPGYRSKPANKWVGRIVAVVGVLALLIALIVQRNLAMLVVTLLAVPAVMLVSGIIGLGRVDRIVPYLGAYGLTLIFSPLLALGLVLAIVLYVYFFIEDAASGFPGLRRFFHDVTSPEAKREKLSTPQFARLAAVIQG